MPTIWVDAQESQQKLVDCCLEVTECYTVCIIKQQDFSQDWKTLYSSRLSNPGFLFLMWLPAAASKPEFNGTLKRIFVKAYQVLFDLPGIPVFQAICWLSKMKQFTFTLPAGAVLNLF